MKVLYISITFLKKSEGSNLYTDLAEEINEKNEITVLVSEEERCIEQTKINTERGIEILRVKTGNMFNVSLIEKAISYILIPFKLKRAINKYLNDRQYDLIVFTSPPVTLGKVIKYAMKKYKAKSYLMQKDIFPQNALDIKILNKANPAYWYFRHKEKQIYKASSIIGCMSQGNIKYILENNKYLDKDKLEIFPNTIKIIDNHTKKTNIDIKRKYKIPQNSLIVLYGGNFGKPQGIEFIEKVLELYKNDERITFVFAGKGTEKEKLYSYIERNKISNVLTLEFIPKDEYNNFLYITDIGLIFLDYRFTIPNIPSRTLSYFEYGIPIMAATDKNTDYREIIEKEKVGLWCESNNIEQFKEKFNLLIEDKELRKKMGQNGRKYLEENLTTEKSVEILEKAYKRLKKEGV